MNESSISPSRWYAKKISRRCAMLGSQVKHLFPDVALLNKNTVHIITYHRFGDSTRDPFTVTAQNFELQMRWLREEKRIISLDTLEKFLFEGRDVPAGATLVTIDDGSESVFHTALPVLKEYRVPAVLYTVAGAVGAGRGPNNEQPEDYMGWAELEVLASNGITIGSHNWQHVSFTSLGKEERIDYALRSREELESRLGIQVRSFAYPFGTVSDFDIEAAQTLKQVGYTTAFTSQHGSVKKGDNPFLLSRVKVEGGENLYWFKKICNGHMNVWRIVDKGLWSLQNGGRSVIER